MDNATRKFTPGAPVTNLRNSIAAATRLEARHGDAMAKPHGDTR
jgi:hypothetical protein